MKKVLIVASTSGFIKGFLLSDAKMLQELGYEVGTVKYYAQIHSQVWQNSVCTGQGNLPLIT